MGHETTLIGEIHPAEPAGWSRVGVPGWVPLALTLDSNDLTRLHGFDAREAGWRVGRHPCSQEYFRKTVYPYTCPVKPARSSPAAPPSPPRVAGWKA